MSGTHRPTASAIAGALLLILTFTAVAWANAQPAHASVTGGCDGSADFALDGVGPYGPNNDTTGNPIIVPKTDGETVNWQGSVPGENMGFSGTVEINIGPAWITVADWGAPNYDGSNTNDLRSDRGVYNLDDAYDELPVGRNLLQGIYEARATHNASGVNCSAQFFVKFEGEPLSSPIVIVSIVLLVLTLILLISAGRRRSGAHGFFAGRPVRAIVAALVLAITIAILLQQFCAVPLNNTTVILLPIAMVIIGFIIAKFAPFGGAAPVRGMPSGSTGDEPIFSDGFESGDTSAWTDDQD